MVSYECTSMSHVASPEGFREESTGSGIDASTCIMSPKSSATRRSRSAFGVTSPPRPACSTELGRSESRPSASGDGAFSAMGSRRAQDAISASVGSIPRRHHDVAGIGFSTPACYLTGREIVPENAIRRVQHRERGAAYWITIGEIAADQPRAARGPLRRGHDDDVGVEGANELDAHEFESKGTLRKGFHCFDRG